jgi:molecular chaperone GrpE
MSKKRHKDKKMNPEQHKAESSETRIEEELPTAEDSSPEAQISRLETEVRDLNDKYLRAMAEFENYRRRTIAEKADWIRTSTQKLALEICDVVDNFERAFANAKPADLANPFFQGIQLIEKQLAKALEKEGVKKIEALGKEFDPDFHDALAHIPSEYDENIVAAIIQNGYTMHDKVIRPVRVAVSNGTKN